MGTPAGGESGGIGKGAKTFLAISAGVCLIGFGLYVGAQALRGPSAQLPASTLADQLLAAAAAAKPYVPPVVNNGQAFIPQQNAAGKSQLPTVPGSKWGPVYPDAQGDKKLDECDGKKGLSVVVNGTLYDCY